MNAAETPFIISTASCGSAETAIVTARSMIDVKRTLLATRWSPNGSYFYQNLGLTKKQQMLAVIVGVASGKEHFHDLTPTDLGGFGAWKDLNDLQLICVLPDELVEQIFDFAFTGGEGEQEGNPGKEWITITVRPLVLTELKSIHREFDSSIYMTAAAIESYQKAAGFSFEPAE